MKTELTNKLHVSLVSAACLLGLVIVLKNILLVPVQILTQNIVLFIMFYAVYGVLCPNTSTEKKNTWHANPLYWDLLVILVTVAIIAVYAI